MGRRGQPAAQIATPHESALRTELSELLRLFYLNGWVSGTGGGICARLDGDHFLLAPTAVHKERVKPEDFFVVGLDDGRPLQRPADPTLRPSECNAIFRAIMRHRGAGAVMHSHALSGVLAADLASGGALPIQGFEMLKGIRGCSNRDTHLVPVVENAEREFQVAGAVERAICDPRYARAFAVLARDHGAYIWGQDVSETKRHAEVYHFLFEGVWARGVRRDRVA